MSASSGSRARLAIKAQPNYVTRAAANGFLEVPFNTFALETTRASLESATIRSDREVSDFRLGARSATGQIVQELRYGDAATELLMQSGMFSSFASNEMTLGSQRTFITAEDQALDISTFGLFHGMEVSRLGFSIQPGQMIMMTSDLIGRDGVVSNASTAGTITPGQFGNEPMDAFSGSVFDEIGQSGQEINTITGLDFQIDNAVRPLNVVGDYLPQSQEYGRARVTGSLTMLYTGPQQLQRFLSEAPFALQIGINDPAGNDYLFTMPRVKYTGAQKPVTNEQSRSVTLPFVALRPATGSIQSALRIQR